MYPSIKATPHDWYISHYVIIYPESVLDLYSEFLIKANAQLKLNIAYCVIFSYEDRVDQLGCVWTRTSASRGPGRPPESRVETAAVVSRRAARTQRGHEDSSRGLHQSPVSQVTSSAPAMSRLPLLVVAVTASAVAQVAASSQGAYPPLYPGPGDVTTLIAALVGRSEAR